MGRRHPEPQERCRALVGTVSGACQALYHKGHISGFLCSLSCAWCVSRQTFYPLAKATAGDGCSAGRQTRCRGGEAVLHSAAGPEWLPRLGLEAQGYAGHGGFMSSRS